MDRLSNQNGNIEAFPGAEKQPQQAQQVGAASVL